MCVSLIGTWMQNIAQPWLVYTLTDSAFLLSVVSALQFTPVLLFSLFAGVFIDKYPKKQIIVFTQAAFLVITLALAILVWSGRVQYWHILIAAAAMGMVNTLDMPARQAFVIELVGRTDLMNAIALNSAIFNGARVIGPALAGLIMSYFSIAFCFLINAVSFAGVLASLIWVKPQHPSALAPRQGNSMWAEAKEGLRYIYQQPVLLKTIVLITIIGTFGINVNVLVPVFATEVLNQNEAGFGFLMSFMGVGSFLGAMLIASTSQTSPRKEIVTLLPAAIAIFLVLTGLTRTYWLTALCLALAGFFFIAFTSLTNSTLQLHTNDIYRGRVMSIYALVLTGSAPIGNLFAGGAAHAFGASIGFVACGVMILLFLLPLPLLKTRKGKEAAPPDPLIGDGD